MWDLRHPIDVGYDALRLLFEVRFLVGIGLSPEPAKSLAIKRACHWQIEKRSPNTTQCGPSCSVKPIGDLALDRDQRRRGRDRLDQGWNLFLTPGTDRQKDAPTWAPQVQRRLSGGRAATYDSASNTHRGGTA